MSATASLNDALKRLMLRGRAAIAASELAEGTLRGLFLSIYTRIIEFFRQNICTFQKIVVILQREMNEGTETVSSSF